ncbi:anti-sigma factor C-terminal domain-containing protein [Rummeliibacillus stabekisii]|uniref:anti sigma factor C-terminal domain-containing protein n=1 Tax=Rummeliibacillus stabekisii TaxID=241244 RepID=UPI0020420A83|nr:anti sigma factor C-terminal domain-containing protein [Rummeliibacillus stabekisii]MCM3316914.1 anti-sigma factor C-terminal domain-containing protein [Rummeliibacillus stabekisii]
MDKDSIFNKNDGFQPLIKKAKRKSLKKTIIISTIVTLGVLLVIGFIFIIAHYQMQRSMSEYLSVKRDQSEVYGANIGYDKSTTSYNLDSSINQDQYVKDVAGIPYTWYNEQTWFKIYDSPTTIYNNEITASSNNEQQYYRNGQRVVNFYVPSGKKIEDDREFLKSLPLSNSVELAISFKEEMSTHQMLNQFPTAQWAWVQNPDADISIMPRYVIGDYAYGFTITAPKKGIEGLEKDVENFRVRLSNLSKEDEKDTHVKPLLKSIRQKGAVLVSGVIVTGKVQDLLPLIKKETVNHVSVGVIIPY